MLVEIKHEAIRIISHVQVQHEDHTEELERQRREKLARQMRFEHLENVLRKYRYSPHFLTARLWRSYRKRLSEADFHRD